MKPLKEINLDNPIFVVYKEELKEKIKQEGDFYEWTNSFKCFIQRNTLGFWCGYIQIPKPFSELIEEIHLIPHGGITYNSQETNGDIVIGFDCGHYLDLIPIFYFQDQTISLNSAYRDKEYVMNEVNKMADDITNYLSNKRSLKIEKVLLSLYS
jgi:hypothetical protein